MNDYPHFGVWPDGYYMTVNQFGTTGNTAGIAVFERDRMLTGDAGARMIKFDPQGVSTIWQNLGGQLPADLDGFDPPPAGTPGFVLQWDDSSWIGDPGDTMRVWEVEIDWSTGTGRMGLNGNFTPDHLLTTADATPLECEPGSTTGQERPCLKQPSTQIRLDDIADGRFMYRVGYRWFGSHDALVAMNTVTGSAAYRAAPRWYELRGLAAGAPFIHQQGTYAPDTVHRWMGSIGMDREGNVALGYSRVDAATSIKVGIAYTGRRLERSARHPAAGRSGDAGGRRQPDLDLEPLGRLLDADPRPDRRLRLLVHQRVLHGQLERQLGDAGRGLALRLLPRPPLPRRLRAAERRRLGRDRPDPLSRGPDQSSAGRFQVSSSSSKAGRARSSPRAARIRYSQRRAYLRKTPKDCSEQTTKPWVPSRMPPWTK